MPIGCPPGRPLTTPHACVLTWGKNCVSLLSIAAHNHNVLNLKSLHSNSLPFCGSHARASVPKPSRGKRLHILLTLLCQILISLVLITEKRTFGPASTDEANEELSPGRSGPRDVRPHPLAPAHERVLFSRVNYSSVCKCFASYKTSASRTRALKCPERLKCKACTKFVSGIGMIYPRGTVVPSRDQMTFSFFGRQRGCFCQPRRTSVAPHKTLSSRHFGSRRSWECEISQRLMQSSRIAT